MSWVPKLRPWNGAAINAGKGNRVELRKSDVTTLNVNATEVNATQASAADEDINIASIEAVRADGGRANAAMAAFTD